jgi:hypothetical protein
VAQVALEVVDSGWWKQQLRAKNAGSKTTVPIPNGIKPRLMDFGI